MRRLAPGLLAVSLLAFQAHGVQGAPASFADPAFQQQWNAGEAVTPNFWGGAVGPVGLRELYQEAQGGQRLVQYFDKGRMELTNGKVTNGLLASEIVKGQIQVGDAAFQTKEPPAIPIAGDSGNPGPTYAALRGKAASLLAPADSQPDSIALATVAADGMVTPGSITADANGAVTATGQIVGGSLTIRGYDDVTHHNVPGVFGDYRAKAGLQTIGLAISEPFAANVKVGGQQNLVIIQVFERRVLTYTATNDPAFQVEMGNIGQHYYQWRTSSGSGIAPPVAPPSQATTAPPVSSAPGDPSLVTGETGTGAPVHRPSVSLPTNLPPPADALYVPPTNLTCASFPNQAAAQEFLRVFPGDPSHLDPSKTGIACARNPAPTDLTPVKRP